jgi:SAM-dependent methyltransferase
MSDKTPNSESPTDTGFDRYHGDYSATVNSAIGFSGLKVNLFARMKARYLTDIARELSRSIGGRQLLALDVGCGVGLIHNTMQDAPLSLVGVDVSRECLDTASRVNQAASYAHFDGAHLPFATACFDLAWTVCVLHHVQPDHWGDFCTELARVIRPGGQLVVIEHNPSNPLTRWAVSNCEFDRDAVLLRASDTRVLLAKAGLERISVRYIETLPLTGPLHMIDRLAGRLPIGAQYLCAGTKPG